MARKKIKSSTDQRPFIMVYHDFFESSLLNEHEKMVFIALKKFAGDKNQCFPRLKLISDDTGISKRKVQEILQQLKQKNVISIENRFRNDGGNTSNFYTLHDYAEMWGAGSSEEIAEIVYKHDERELINELEARGYTVTKEKVPETLSSDQRNNESSTHNNYNSEKNTTSQPEKSQDLERYTIEQIHQLFDYDIMLIDNPFQKRDIDSIMDVLHTAMNTSRPVIRIAGQDKPAMAVIGKLMKLDKESIMYAIRKFSEQTDRIKNPVSYMLTILYHAPEQYHLDIENQVSHDMMNQMPDDTL